MTKVTINDVAKAAGVSRALVSIAYRGVPGVSEATAQHIFQIGKKLGYVPNLNAARLASKKLNTIGVFLQDLHNEVFADVFDGIRSVIGQSDNQIVLAVGSAEAGHDAKALETLIASQVDVIIAAGLTMSDAQLLKFATRTKLVSVTRKVAKVSSVTSDDYMGAKLAVGHLISRGHSKIAFLANPQTDGYTDRLRGYRDAVIEAGLSPLIQETTYSRVQAELDAASLIAKKPTAIFAHNDMAALGVVDALVSEGLKPGVDVDVVGFDNTSLSQTPVLALTTVDPQSHTLGQEAAKIALGILKNGGKKLESVQLTPTLVIRSTAP
ncbi:MAG: hypothetical protein RLZ53_955 [Actinomycetota bacterium]